MATWFKKSLSEDMVDRYNFNWAVLLFLLLALICLLLPLSPFLSESSQTVSVPTLAIPRVEAKCWCPPHFTGSMASFSNAVCAASAIGILKGYGESLYEPNFEEYIPMNGDLNSKSNIFETKRKEIEDIKKMVEKKIQREKSQSGLCELINFRAPVVLFLFALILKVPKLLWMLFSHTAFSCFNIDETLKSCLASQSLDASSRCQWKEDTVQAVSKSVQSSGSKLSCLYLLMKVLAIVVVIGETIFVSQIILKDIHGMQKDYDNDKQIQTMSKALFEIPDSVLVCTFRILKFNINTRYYLQCHFSVVKDAVGGTADIDSSVPTFNHGHSVLVLYQALFTIVLAVLVVLVIASVINLVSWVLRLFVGSFAMTIGLPSNAAMDVVFLVHMAWINAGPVVARSLADDPNWSKGRNEPEGMALHDLKC